MQITIQTERRSSSEVPPIITLHPSVPHLFVLFLISPVCANTIILINPHKFIIPHSPNHHVFHLLNSRHLASYMPLYLHAQIKLHTCPRSPPIIIVMIM